jgi:hypothetical protein
MYSSKTNRRCGGVFYVTTHPVRSAVLSITAGVIDILRSLNYKNWQDEAYGTLMEASRQSHSVPLLCALIVNFVIKGRACP